MTLLDGLKKCANGWDECTFAEILSQLDFGLVLSNDDIDRWLEGAGWGR